VRAVVEEAFKTHGMPRAIRSDNGPPFASTGAAGLSRLSLDWVKAGIALERIEPGKPQQNGRHERMHRTLKAETSRPPAATLAEQQARFDAFRDDFNHHRPHEALGQQPPADFYRPSPRPWPDILAEPWYDADHAERRVRTSGEIKWGGKLIYVSEVLTGEPVGVAETRTGDWIVRYADIDLGTIDRKTSKFHRFSAARPGRAEAKQKQNTATMYPVHSVTYVPGCSGRNSGRPRRAAAPHKMGHGQRALESDAESARAAGQASPSCPGRDRLIARLRIITGMIPASTMVSAGNAASAMRSSLAYS
jgi:hypothetical protein